jgi:hypothetical protein
MSRINGIKDREAGWFARLVYRFARQRLGRVPVPLRVMAHHSWVLAGSGGFEMALERSHAVEERVKVLAEIRAATLVGCPF